MFPAVISRRIKSIMEKFLWSGRKLESKLHLASWSTVARSIGGWGFMELENFNKSLVIKNRWCALNEPDLWHDVSINICLGRCWLSGSGES